MSRIVTLALMFLSFVASGFGAPASNVLEKKFPFPSPIQWKVGNFSLQEHYLKDHLTGLFKGTLSHGIVAVWLFNL